MDKNAIKKYAVWAREELIKRVSARAEKYGISKDNMVAGTAETVNGILLTSYEKEKRTKLIAQIKTKGYEQVMEEVAYTWFNRFCALRFMEVNNYLPTHIRVFTDENNKFEPQIMAEAIHLELDGLDKSKVLDLKEKNANDELYKYLLITQCNALSSILPGMFQKISDYTELLFPDNILREGSVIAKMIEMIPQDNFDTQAENGQVEIIGWLYQYYNDERKNEVINIYKGTVKKEDIPAATQLFTTDWIVRYIVDNSLGRYWIERNPNSNLQNELTYFVTPKNGEIAPVNEAITPKDLTVFDPCMGSGHFLVYTFELLMKIYKECAYSDRDAVSSIMENNLFGLDIDDRASQLAYFAVMMKACEYDKRFLSRKDDGGKPKIPQPKIYAIDESNGITSAPMHDMGINLTQTEYGVAVQEAMRLVEEMQNAKEFGSLISITACDWDLLRRFAVPRDDSGQIQLDIYGEQEASKRLQHLVNIAEVLCQKYAVVATNPPYLNKFDPTLKKFVQDNFKDYSGDLFSVFMYRNFDFCKIDGYSGFMTPFVWMFIKTYEKLREYTIKSKSITSLIQMEYSAFEEATVPICSFIFKNGKEHEKGLYFKLSDFKGGMEVQKQKVLEALDDKNCGYFYETSAENFSKIPGSPIAYWVSGNGLKTFESGKPLGEIAAPRKGNSTSDNNRFLRLWFEIDQNTMNLNNIEISVEGSIQKRWYPYNKGGGYRKWYGFNEYLIDWKNDAAEIRAIKSAVVANYQYFMKPGLTWSTLSSKAFSVRWFDEGYIFDNGGCCIFELGTNRPFIIAVLNSKVFTYIFGQLNPTLNFQSGEVAKFPVIKVKNENIDKLALSSVDISKNEYNSFETSWDFTKHPLLKYPFKYDTETGEKEGRIELFFECWENHCKKQFTQLKQNEEELNRIFIDIYGLQDELTPEVEDKDVTVRLADKTRDIKSFISYAVGCMFGRYSLYNEGLLFAGGHSGHFSLLVEKIQDHLKAQGLSMFPEHEFYPDEDNIIPICDDEYFDDDIVGRFVKFVEAVYGVETLTENLKFIADALGGKGQPKDVIRNYFLNDFFADHCKTYQKRPIYWLFDSGKKNGFKALIYMHRYQPDTLARMRTDYVHEQQGRYRTAINDLQHRLSDASTAERVKLTKQLAKIQDQDTELRIYEEKIHHLADQMIPIDLDDGVKHNYERFQDVLAKIK